MASDRSPKHINEGMNEVAEPAPPATQEKINVAAPPDHFYVRNDTIVGNPLLALGRVLYEVEGETAPRTFLFRLDVEPREDTILKTPQARQELLVKKSAALNISVLSMLSAEGSAEDVFEFRIVDNAAGALDTGNDAFAAAVDTWRARADVRELYANPKVRRIYLVIGVVQKYVSTKYYKKYSAEAKGGGWGVNVGGELYLSSSNYRLDIVYGLDLVVLREAGAEADDHGQGGQTDGPSLAPGATLETVNAGAHPEMVEAMLALTGSDETVQGLFAD